LLNLQRTNISHLGIRKIIDSKMPEMGQFPGGYYTEWRAHEFWTKIIKIYSMQVFGLLPMV